MKLYISGNSPYARRARIAAREGGLSARVEEVVISGFDELLAQGPGGKIPILVTDSGVSLCESLIITRYLNEASGGRLLPDDPDERLTCLAMESVASVLMDSLFVRSMENNHRPEELKSEAVLTREAERGRRCYDALENTVAGAQQVTLASIAVVAALGYAEWRHPQDNWRDGRPQLGACYDRFMAREAFAETAPVF